MNDWGWDPTTLSAVGTLFASVLSGLALNLAIRQQRDNSEDKRKAHARLVSVRPEHLPMVERFMKRQLEAETTSLNLVLNNAGTAPIRNLGVVALFAREPEGDMKLFFGTQETVAQSYRPARHVPWRHDQIVWADLDWGHLDPGVRQLTVTTSKENKPTSLGITFTDVDGHQWTRSITGALYAGARLRKGFRRAA